MVKSARIQVDFLIAEQQGTAVCVNVFTAPLTTAVSTALATTFTLADANLRAAIMQNGKVIATTNGGELESCNRGRGRG